ncbi:NAD(P)H-quinone oxidoreductase [Thalassotalea crassostreae]|uniref:NAD(P)H-quinone oxidoreductase n=1 Tax=Thalassotalea crassostreae TaxID=1763536 RepID=UPI000838D07F|nr:NAD(P)H-quinone oxidoreductase [Thalassotalea crassostreae]
MKIINVNEQQELVFSDANIPEINEDECLIAVKAIGINRADLLQRAGKYPPPAGESLILGIEACGVISKVGTKVSNVDVNDNVFALVPGGAYAEFVKVKANHLIPLPSNFSFEQGAAIAEVFLTAYQSLFTIAKLQKSDQVLMHGGASGVGTAAIQLAKAAGAFVTVTVSSENKAEACIKLGADNVVNYKQQNIVDWKKQHLKQGFDVIIDIVGGNELQKNIDVVAQDGRLVTLAMLGGRFCEQVDVAKMLLKRVNIHASTLRNRSDQYKQQLVQDFTEQFYQSLIDGKLQPVIDTVFSWQDADLAHQKMSRNENIGKYILTVN